MRTSRTLTHVQCRNHLLKVRLGFVTEWFRTQKCKMKLLNKLERKLSVKSRFMKKRSWSFFWLNKDLLQWTTITLTNNLISLSICEWCCSIGSLTCIWNISYILKHFSLPSTSSIIFFPPKLFTEQSSNLSESQLYGLHQNIKRLIKFQNFLTLSTFVIPPTLTFRSFLWKVKFYLKYNSIFWELLHLDILKLLRDTQYLAKRINFWQDIYLKVCFLMSAPENTLSWLLLPV